MKYSRWNWNSSGQLALDLNAFLCKDDFELLILPVDEKWWAELFNA